MLRQRDALKRRPWLFVVGIVGLEVLVALPFVIVSAQAVRGFPGPLLVVLALVAAFAAGPVAGVVAMGATVLLGASLIGLSVVATVAVWVPTAYAVGLVGRRVRQGEQLRADLLRQLRGGLVPVSGRLRIGALDVISRYRPAVGAQILGGDFFGIVEQPDRSVAVIIGDVTGHGPEAAAVATQLRAAWRALAVAGLPPHEIAGLLNEAVVAQRAAGRDVQFATVCLGSIRADRRTATFVNAGHPSPVMLSATGRRQLAVSANPMLGLKQQAEFSASDVTLPQAPWTLLLFTDGLFEGRQSPGGARPFGEERVLRLLEAHHPPLSAAAIDELITHVERANGSPMADDMIVLGLSADAAGHA